MVKKRGAGGVLLGVLAILLAGAFVAGIVLGSGASSTTGVTTPAGRPEIVHLLSAPGCTIPLLLLAAGLVVLLYYARERLNAQVRIWRAQAAAEETAVERQRVELNDLTPGPDGQELGRLIQAPDGRVLLVSSRLAAGPVTLVDPASARRPDEVPDNLQLAALLGNALSSRPSGKAEAGSSSNPALDGLVMYLVAQGMGYGAGGLPGMEGRVPGRVRILDEGETRMLEAGREG